MREHQPSSPVDVMLRRLDSPEPSRSPELTSRSLQRVSDGYSQPFDYYSSDEGLDLQNDDNNEEYWRRNLCTEPQDSESTYAIKKLMQGKVVFDKWANSAALMENEKKENPNFLEESHYPLTSCGLINLRGDENIVSVINSEKKELQHSREELEFDGRRQIEGYMPDHEENNSDDLYNMNSSVHNHQINRKKSEQVDEAGEIFLYSSSQVKELLILDYSSVFLLGENDVRSKSQFKGGVQGSQHNQEQFCGRLSPPFRPINLSQDEGKPGPRTIGSIFDSKDAHKTLLEQSDQALTVCQVQAKDEVISTAMKIRRDITAKIIDIPIASPAQQSEEVQIIRENTLVRDTSHASGNEMKVANAPPSQKPSVSIRKSTESTGIRTDTKDIGYRSIELPTKDPAQGHQKMQGISLETISLHDKVETISHQSCTSNSECSHAFGQKIYQDDILIDTPVLNSKAAGDNSSEAKSSSLKRDYANGSQRQRSYLRKSHPYTSLVACIRPKHAAEEVAGSSSTTSFLPPSFSPKLFEVQKQVEHLKNKLADEHEQKRVLSQRLTEQRKEFERVSQAKHDLWETKLRELQKDKYALQIRLQVLGGEDPRQRIKRNGEKPNLTEGEIKLLRREITEQEALIKGYQIENEKAVKRLKDLESSYKERVQLMEEENARLASQLASVQFSSSATVYGSTPNISKENQALRLDLHALKAREATLTLEIEKERKANKELENCLAIIKKDKEEEQGTLKKMLANERTEHAHAIDQKEHQSKLYLDSQELVHSLQLTIEDQAAIITDLRRKVEVLEANEDEGKENDNDWRTQFKHQENGNISQKNRAVKQIEGLQKQVKMLETALEQRKDYPTGNQKIRLSSDDHDAKIKKLQDEVASLRRKVREDASGHALQTLKQEHEQLKQEYNVQIRQLKKEKAAFESVPSYRKKDKHPDKHVDDVRTFYIKKVRELTKQLEDARKASSRAISNLEPKKGADKAIGKMLMLLHQVLKSRF